MNWSVILKENIVVLENNLKHVKSLIVFGLNLLNMPLIYYKKKCPVKNVNILEKLEKIGSLLWF